VQFLVYLFISIAALAIGALGYFALTFTVIEAILVTFVTLTLAMSILERSLRVRSENRLEKGIDDLARLLSTDAQAGQVLNQRINALTKIDAGNRLDILEADISVLGTVMRQVAEAVSDIESAREESPLQTTTKPNEDVKFGKAPTFIAEMQPVIPMETLRQALAEDRLVFHMQPILTLPRRQVLGYDLLPRLKLEDGEIADSVDFMPLKNGDDLIRQIEKMGIEEAVTIVRRARTSGQPAALFVPISKSTLSDKTTTDRLVGMFDANRVVSQNIVMRITDGDWRSLSRAERSALDDIAAKDIKFSITDAKSLRLDYAELASSGVTSVRFDATQFINDATSLTDFHTSDVADYVSRFGVELIAQGIKNEQQILTVLEDGVKFAQGLHLAGPSPVRADFLTRGDDRGRSAQQAKGA
jgi:cyclic-di-GMP phosphodiesterase TipF (flagellum assembly factor)